MLFNCIVSVLLVWLEINSPNWQRANQQLARSHRDQIINRLFYFSGTFQSERNFTTMRSLQSQLLKRMKYLSANASVTKYYISDNVDGKTYLF